MQTQSFRSDSSDPSETVTLSVSLKLHSYPKRDREPVKVLVIGSKQSVTAIVNTLHLLGFAETFEWTDFLPAPSAERPLQCQPEEVMKALVKYLPKG
jgi:hypothetical protein